MKLLFVRLIMPLLLLGMLFMLISRIPSPDDEAESPPPAENTGPAEPDSAPSIAVFPDDKAQDVSLSTNFGLRVPGPNTGAFLSRRAELVDEDGRKIPFSCAVKGTSELIYECQPASPLDFGTTYNASISYTIQSALDGMQPRGTREWSFTTHSRSERVNGILSTGVRVWAPSEGEEYLTVQGLPGTLPAAAFTDGWEVSVHSEGEQEYCMLEANGGFFGYVDIKDDMLDLLLERGLELEVVNTEGEGLARFPIGPATSRDRRTIYFVRGIPFDLTTPDGVWVRFDGTSEKSKIGIFYVAPLAAAECDRPYLNEVQFVGCWEMKLNYGIGAPSEDYERAKVPVPRPGLQIAVPGPPVSTLDDTLVFDVAMQEAVVLEFFDAEVPLVNGIGKTFKREGKQYFSLGADFRFENCQMCSRGITINPTKALSRDLNGIHAVFYDDMERLTLTSIFAGTRTDSHALNYQQFAIDLNTQFEIAAPLSVFFKEHTMGNNGHGHYYILPVVANDEVNLFTNKGYINSRKDLETIDIEGVPRKADAVQHLGTFYELRLRQKQRYATD